MFSEVSEKKGAPVKSIILVFIATASVAFCLFLILQLPTFTKVSFVIWISIGLVVYFVYGYKHSILNSTSNSKN